MIQIRNSVFETNSSSTHSICITTNKQAEFPDFIDFQTGYFGWGEDEVSPANYLYTAIMLAGSYDESRELLDKLAEYLDKWGVEYRFGEVKLIWTPSCSYSPEPYPEYEYCEIDHYCEFKPLMYQLLDNEDLLRRYLSSESVIYTGNDNCWDDENPPKSYAYEPFLYRDVQDKNGEWVVEKHKNPWHDEEKYEYFVKGN